MRRGFTLIETMISIVLLGIFLTAGMLVLSTSSSKGARVEIISVAQSLAEGKLEETRAKSFAAISSVAQTSYTGDLSNYSYEVVVGYVNAADLNTVVGSATDYKKIQVKIRHPQLATPITFETVRANY
jgi:prepilin-type N-terminal cleavage/methylation domain-containing protein